MTPRWEPLDAADLDRMEAIERVIHAGLPEAPDLMDEKRSLFPEGCRKLMRGEAMVGYGLAHPWLLGYLPMLNRSLGALPHRPDCLHMHDVAILPEGRGLGSAGLYVDHLRGLARGLGIGAMACVSVYGTAPLWARHGFTRAERQPDAVALASYGGDGVYMVAAV